MKKKNCDSLVDEKLNKTSDSVVDSSNETSKADSFSYTSFMQGLFKKHPVFFVIGALLIVVLVFNLLSATTFRMTEGLVDVGSDDYYPELEIDNVTASLDSDSLSYSSWSTLGDSVNSLSGAASKSVGSTQYNTSSSNSQAVVEPVEHSSIETGASSETLNSASNKIIYYGDLDIRTTNFDATNKVVLEKVNQYGGYIDSYSISDLSATYKVRVPYENFDSYMSDSEIFDGNEVTSKVTSKDITIEYADTSSTLESLKIREERLLSYLSSAANVSEMLDIEEELQKVRGEIQKHQTLLNTMDSFVKFSEINVIVRSYGVQATTTKLSFWDKLVNTFKEAGRDFADYTEDFVFGFILGVPTFIFFVLRLVIIIFVIWLFLVIIKKFINRAKRKKVKKAVIFDKNTEEKPDVLSDTEDVE